LLAFSPIKLLKTSFNGIETEPKLMFNKNNANSNIVKIKNRIVFRLMIFKIILIAQKKLIDKMVITQDARF
jgi:hypothetical protein